MAASTLSSLPEAFLHPIASYLEAPEVLNLLSCNKALRQLGTTNAAFWSNLCVSISSSPDNEDQANSVAITKRNYLQAAYCRQLPLVQWKTLSRSRGAPSNREGHLACLMTGAAGSDNDSDPGTRDLLIVTGGFTNVAAIHVKSLSDNHDIAWRSIDPTESQPMEMIYGATLTTLDVNRAIRFGGFQSGGYSNETHGVAVLSVDYEDRAAHWAAQSTRFAGMVLPASLSRAYHTATLLLNRYLLIIGGMKTNESTLYPVLLDTHTWTWHEVITAGQEPSARHGHSTILDQVRSRLVIFGGGSGSDLLRSGRDNVEVWELNLSKGWESGILQSFPWTWRLVHDEPAVPIGNATGNNDQQTAARPLLSPSETLILGRCHIAHRVSPKTVILALGSGRPSSNGLIAYDLQADAFFRPSIRGGHITPRLSAASVYLEKQGCIYVHGGYSTQLEQSVADAHILDLAPALSSRLGSFQISAQTPNHPAVTNEEALADRNVDHRNQMEGLMFQLWEVDEADRPRRAAEMLASNDHNGRAAMLLSFLAGGHNILLGDGDDDDDDVDDEDDDDDVYDEDDDDDEHFELDEEDAGGLQSDDDISG